MPLALTTTKDRERCFTSVRLILSEFILPAVSHAEREQLMQYMYGLEQSSDVMGLDATITGDGITTVITIKIQKVAQ